jgi:hypothetical protein
VEGLARLLGGLLRGKGGPFEVRLPGREPRVVEIVPRLAQPVLVSVGHM